LVAVYEARDGVATGSFAASSDEDQSNKRGRAVHSDPETGARRGSAAGSGSQASLALNPRSSKNLMGHAKTSLGYAAFVHGYQVHTPLLMGVYHF
jgi:hypothetical protein